MPQSKSEEENNNKQTVYVGIGTNLGKKKENIEKAVRMLKKVKGIDVILSSPMYKTRAYGNKKQPEFLNGVLKISTSFEPRVLLERLKSVEKDMGRLEEERWGPRIIDLDILFYGNEIIKKSRLTIPHPDLHNRWFVLKPMNDIAPEFEHPVKKKTIGKLLEELNDKI